ncbi:MAG: hypothetical protein GY931_12440 [Maribacter sp.]|nr:hypothetical protein [Maribacter sp.]
MRLQNVTIVLKRRIKLKQDIGLAVYHVMQSYSDSNQTSEGSGKPYTDLEITDKYILREFGDDIDPIELMWHRDDQDRTIEIIGKTDWSIQLEDSLPTSLNERIFIKRHEWHRVIKGTGKLQLKIHLD